MQEPLALIIFSIHQIITFITLITLSFQQTEIKLLVLRQQCYTCTLIKAVRAVVR